MGKIKRIKQERKKAEVAAKIERAKRNQLLIKIAILGVLFVMAGFAIVFSYQYFDKKWSIRTKIMALKEDVFSKEPSKEIEKKERKVYTQAPEMQIDVNKTYVAKFETNKGDFEVTMFAKDAPKTVNNFIVLSRDGFYDGLTFHRIIEDFMIQGGDPSGDGTGGPGYQFEDEINSRKLVRGALAMANSGANTNGSQFFIVTKDKTDWLDGKHTVFGEVIEGLDVVMNIEKTETGENDKPVSPVTIVKITIQEK